MVPDGWAMRAMSELGRIHAGRQRSPSFTEGELMPYLRVANVLEARIDASHVLAMLFSEGEFDRYKLEVGDILLNEGQSLELVGRPAMYAGVPSNCCFQNTLVRFRANADCSPAYALERFRLCLRDGTFQRIAKKTTSIAHLGVSRFAGLELPWPKSVAEQEAVAAVLGVWNRSIQTCSHLVEAASQQKKALAQQLLTGKRRLPGFATSTEVRPTSVGTLPRDWSVVPIGKVATEVSVRNADDKAFPVLACSKHVGFVNSLEYFKKKVYSDDLSNYKVIRRSQFGFPSNHVEEGSIGLQNLCNAGLVSPIYTVFGIDESRVNAGFLFKVLKTDHYRQRFAAATNASVDRRGSLRWSGFKAIRIPLPSLKEQQAISAVLDQAAQLEQGYRQQREKLELEKRALMQQLLTGKRRVKLSSENTAPAKEHAS